MNALEESLLDNNTRGNTVQMIRNKLQQWNGNDHVIPISNITTLLKAVLAQNLIGWKSFLEGCLLIEWKTHTSNLLTKKQSPRRWIAHLVKKLWLVAFDMWDHRCKVLQKNDLSNKVQNLQ